MIRVNHKHQRGYTLIEMIIAIMLMSILSGLLASIIAVNFKTMADVSDRKKLVTRGMLAVNLFERELGMLKNTDAIITADDQTFRFTDTYGNTWEYAISSNNLTRQEIGVGSAVTLATPVINADTKFSYYAQDNSTLGTLPLNAGNIDLITLVKLILVMDDGDTGIPLLSIVYPENLKFYNH